MSLIEVRVMDGQRVLLVAVADGPLKAEWLAAKLRAAYAASAVPLIVTIAPS